MRRESMFEGGTDMRAMTDAAILNMLVNALDGEGEKGISTPGMTEDVADASPKLGERFGHWKVVSLNYQSSSSKERFCLLRCQCGTLKVEKIRLLGPELPQSCGCLQS